MKIRRRLALYGAGVVALAMLGFGLLLNWLGQATAPVEQDKNLAVLAAQTVEALDAAPIRSLVPTSPPVLVDLAESTEAFVLVRLEDGTVLYSTGQLNGAAPEIRAAVVVEALETGTSVLTIRPADNVELRLHARSWNRPAADIEDAVVVAGQSTEFNEEQLAGLRAVIWGSAIVTTIAAVVVGWLVSGRALRPLRKLAETTDEIGSTGDLSRRLPPVDIDDEVGALTRSFNTMLERVESGQNRLTETLEAQRRFVADASHELRTPLTTIRSNAGFLADRPDAGSKDRAEATADILAESERMSHLVDDLLTLAHADAGRPLSSDPVDLTNLVRELVLQGERNGNPIELDVDAGLIVRGDEAALGRLIRILVDNGRKHGGGAASIEAWEENGAVQLLVADEGPGIPEADIGKIFERFYRSDEARSTTGFGLGLAIAREIAEAHGGTIEAANSPVGGAEFLVTLPRA